MRVALVAPLAHPIPPRRYGGIEAVVAALADGLVDRGHDVTLFACAGSRTKATLVSAWPKPLSDYPDDVDWTGLYTHTNAYTCGLVADLSRQFDVIHTHTHENGLVLSKLCHAPVVATFHRELEDAFQRDTFSYYSDVHYVSISDSQRHLMPAINWAATVYNGVDVSRIPFSGSPNGGYLLFLGRISPIKDPASAIDIARATGRRLVIAASLAAADRDYFDTEVAPRLRGYRDAEYIGEVDYDTKVSLYQNAKALLFPVMWNEPFGLVMVESLAAGTPVIGRSRGAVPEIITHGIHGFLGETNDELAEGIRRLDTIDRGACRLRAEELSNDHMVSGYLDVYERVTRDPLAPASPATGG